MHLNGIVVRDLACAVSNYRQAPALILRPLHVHSAKICLLNTIQLHNPQRHRRPRPGLRCVQLQAGTHGCLCDYCLCMKPSCICLIACLGMHVIHCWALTQAADCDYGTKL